MAARAGSGRVRAREALGSGLVIALLATTTRSLHRIALDKQREGRVPGLYAAVCRAGEELCGEGVGRAALASGRPRGRDDQFLIASNTKTINAVMVMKLRDEGR